MLQLGWDTDLSVCSAIVGASFAGAPCPGALVANLPKSQLSQVDFKCVCVSMCVYVWLQIQNEEIQISLQIQSLFQIGF